jgi:hypothetical protein
MQSKSCSRTGSRKSRLPLAFGVAALVLLPGLAAAQTVDLSVSTRASMLSASLSYHGEQIPEVVSMVRKGLESRITFTVRLYEKRSSPIPFIGDRMVTQKRVARSAFWDFLDDRFVVESDDGAQVTYGSAEEFLKGFFILNDLFLSDVPRDARRLLYVTARAQFEPVRLMPPLTLVSLVGGAAISTTPWVRKDVP